MPKTNDGGEDISTTNTSARKPRGKPFKKGEDARRGPTLAERPQDANRLGQRKPHVVATASQARDLYVQVLHETINTAPDPAMSNLELIVRQHVAAAKQGNSDARELLFDRIWGKSTQPMEMKAEMNGRVEVALIEVTAPPVNAND